MSDSDNNGGLKFKVEDDVIGIIPRTTREINNINRIRKPFLLKLINKTRVKLFKIENSGLNKKKKKEELKTTRTSLIATNGNTDKLSV